MQLMTVAAIGVPLAAPVTALVGRWLMLRCRAQLVRAAGELPPGVQVSGHDLVGSWSAQSAAPARKPR